MGDSRPNEGALGGSHAGVENLELSKVRPRVNSVNATRIPLLFLYTTVAGALIGLLAKVLFIAHRFVLSVLNGIFDALHKVIGSSFFDNLVEVDEVFDLLVFLLGGVVDIFAFLLIVVAGNGTWLLIHGLVGFTVAASRATCVGLSGVANRWLTLGATLVGAPAALFVAHVDLSEAAQLAPTFFQDFLLAPSGFELVLRWLGALLLIGTAMTLAYGGSNRSRYCMPCDEFMQDVSLGSYAVHQGPKVLRLLRRKAWTELIPAATAKSEEAYALSASMCAKCHRGFVDLRAHDFLMGEANSGDEFAEADEKTGDMTLVFSGSVGPKTGRAILQSFAGRSESEW